LPVDLANVDRLSDDKVWNWVDRKAVNSISTAHCAQLIPHILYPWLDGMNWRQCCGTNGSGPLPRLTQLVCPPLPTEKPGAVAQVAESGGHTTANWAATHVSRHDTKGNGAAHKPNSVRKNETKQSAATMRAKPVRAPQVGPARQP
jgi:hypothetical protein